MKTHDRILAYCNRLRVKQGMKPLKRLPKGTPEEFDSCPIANALKVEHVCPLERCENRRLPNGNHFHPPRYVRDWILRFDDGAYPELERKP